MFAANTSFSYSFPTNIRFGAGVVQELGPHLKSKGFTKPLLVSDPVVSQLPFFEKIIDTLKKEGITVALFSDVHKNPVKSDVYKGGEAFHAGNCDCIVGIGGGVALDVARAITLRAYHTLDLFDYDDLLDGWKLVTEEIPYFVTIPTNAGTGSEVGRSTVISEDKTHKKRVLFSPRLLAAQIFADPLLTMELPPLVTASTGMDALAHNVEALLAKGFHPMADGIALEAIRLIAENLEKAVFEPDLTSRANMLIASLMGAVAFQKGLGIIHSLAHPLSTLVDAHHGTAISLMFEHGLRYNLPGAEPAFVRLGKAMGLTEKADLAEEAIAFISALKKKFVLPTSLSEIGVKEIDVPQLASLAVADFCLPCNHRPATLIDLETIYSNAL
jgi:alcohol dehydrogenase class IV